MRRVILVVFWLTVLGTLAFIALSKFEYAERLEAKVLRNIKTEDLSELWFSPGGDLVGVGRKDSDLIVRVWSGSAGALLRERIVELPTVKSPAEMAVAVSPDASRVAWSVPSGIHVESEKPFDLRFKKRPAISALVFLRPGQLAVLYADGELEIRDATIDRVTASRHFDIGKRASLLANAPYLAAYSRESGDAFVFDVGAGDKFSLLEYQKYSKDGLVLTLSPLARFAVGTRETMEQQGLSLASPGPIRTLAFYDRNRVLVGGDFPGLYLLGVNQAMQQVVATDPGTTVLASSGSNLAFGGARSVTTASSYLIRNRVYRGISRPPLWLTIALLGLLSPVAIFFIYTTINYLLKKSANLQLPEKHDPKPAEEEGEIPNALIEACRNGDCVLWAGSGLGAQARLPIWPEFLRELVDWAAKGDLAPIAVTGPALAELSQHQSGAAADRMAAALEGSRPAVHGYLRQRFVVASELPQAHQLIKELDFSALVTTNFDNLLERAFPHSGGRVYAARDCEGLARAAGRRDFLLLKPFGDLSAPETIRIGPAQCAEAFRENPALGELFEALFDSRVFLFVGASAEGIEQDLAHLTLPAPTSRKHYALLSTHNDGWMAVADRLRLRYGIEAITYSPTLAQHPEVVEFLRKLVTIIREKSSAHEYYATGE